MPYLALPCHQRRRKLSVARTFPWLVPVKAIFFFGGEGGYREN